MQEREELLSSERRRLILATGQANALQRVACSKSHVEKRWRTACHANRKSVFCLFLFPRCLVKLLVRVLSRYCARCILVCVLCGLLFPCVIAYECSKQLLFVRGVY